VVMISINNCRKVHANETTFALALQDKVARARPLGVRPARSHCCTVRAEAPAASVAPAAAPAVPAPASVSRSFTNGIATNATEVIGNTPMVFLNRVTEVCFQAIACSGQASWLPLRGLDAVAHRCSSCMAALCLRFMCPCGPLQGCYAQVAAKLEIMEPCCSVKVCHYLKSNTCRHAVV
jgi:hypothetical protein